MSQPCPTLFNWLETRGPDKQESLTPTPLGNGKSSLKNRARAQLDNFRHWLATSSFEGTRHWSRFGTGGLSISSRLWELEASLHQVLTAAQVHKSPCGKKPRPRGNPTSSEYPDYCGTRKPYYASRSMSERWQRLSTDARCRPAAARGADACDAQRQRSLMRLRTRLQSETAARIDDWLSRSTCKAHTFDDESDLRAARCLPCYPGIRAGGVSNVVEISDVASG